MMDVDSFETAVGISGIWPEPPTFWSFSALDEVALCPRRYALSRASYPDLWDRPGYPERVSEAALLGAVIHESVEVVLRELNQAGCDSLAEARAVEVIRRLGGYSEIATHALDGQLRKLAPNPRMSPRVDRLRQGASSRLTEMRRAIQTLVSRSPLTPPRPGADSVRPAEQRFDGRLTVGMHPETTLSAREDRFTGRIDLVAVYPEHTDIVDFKTGDHSERHERQIQLYGLLWMLDDVANPRRRPIRSLTLGYVDGLRAVAPPDDWEALRIGLREEILAADEVVRERWPRASPAAHCWHCPVRQLCDEYWESTFVNRDPEAILTDAAVRVLSRHGPSSWNGTLVPDGTTVLLRSSTEDAVFELEREVRILDLVVAKAEDFEGQILTLTHSSEVFGLVDRSPTRST